MAFSGWVPKEEVLSVIISTQIKRLILILTPGWMNLKQYLSLKIIFYLVFCGIIFSGCDDTKVIIEKNTKGCILSNGKIKVVCEIDENGYLFQYFFALNKAGAFQEVVSSFKPVYPKEDLGDITELYNTSISPYRYLASEIISELSIDKKTKTIIITGKKDSLSVVQPNIN